MFLCRDIVTFSRVEESSGSTDSPNANEENDDDLDSRVWVQSQGRKEEPNFKGPAERA